MAEFLESLDRGIVFTPNVDHIMRLRKDTEFRQAYTYADYSVCDSMIVIFASRLLGTPLKEKLSGSDIFPAFYQYHQHNDDIRIFLAGAAEGVAKRAQEIINHKMGREMVVGAYSPPFGFEKSEAECDRIIDMVNQSGATVLALGVGAPKQEKWIAKHHHRFTTVRIFMGIGATIDFEAGEKPRSPVWMSNLGIEWIHRLASEPKRLWKRYLIEDAPFLWLVLLEWLKRR
jgi:exopolysaccharide biosynthesis WecB/TagA/CpsF family protein